MIPLFGSRFEPEGRGFESLPACHQSDSVQRDVGEAVRRSPQPFPQYKLKTQWRDGTTHILMERHELLERLAPLIPPPQAHQVHYFPSGRNPSDEA